MIATLFVLLLSGQKSLAFYYGGSGYGGQGYGGGGYGNMYNAGFSSWFDWDISSWICMGLGILFLIIVCCLICSPCICTLCAGSIAALGLGKSRKSKSKNNQTAPPPTIITTQSYPPPQQHQMAAPPAPVQSYPVPLEQKNITIYESGTKPVPRERKEVRIREASSMSEDGRYYTVRRNENHQGLMRSPPRADKIVYTHQNERYYNGTRN